jgi:signal transduction histidine kinase
MDRVVLSVRRRFVATIILVVTFVVALSWGILQWYNVNELSTPAHISEVQKTSESNESFAEYLEQQKAYEAHFLTLASEIKQQEADRVTRALALTTVIVVSAGIAAAILAAKKLVRPVEEAYRSQERFIQDAAHELRNPLAAMTVALQQADTKIQKTPLVMTFRRQTKRLINISEDLLFLERHNGQKISRILLSELLEDVIEELQPIAASRNITIKTNNEPGLFKNMSSTDYVRLVKNVVDNAIKYSDNSKSIQITQARVKNTIVITVKDFGIGIPKNDIPVIGNRFFRASNTGNIDGTGLGLAIVQKILNTYGGSKEIVSAAGKGTTITLRLPA